MGHESKTEACLASGRTNGHAHGSGRASGLLESCSVDRTELGMIMVGYSVTRRVTSD